MGILLIILFAFQKYTSKEKEEFPDVQFITQPSALSALLSLIPNELDEKQWQNLGLQKNKRQRFSTIRK
jgi:hypothetical protein